MSYTTMVDGVMVRYDYEYDDCIAAPWKEYDCYGVVSEWTTRAKMPNERVLASDRGSKRYYDWNASMERAVSVWGFKPGKDSADAVQKDFERLLSWCDGKWFYAVVTVWVDGTNRDGAYSYVCGGVESDYVEQWVQDDARYIVADWKRDQKRAQFARDYTSYALQAGAL